MTGEQQQGKRQARSGRGQPGGGGRRPDRDVEFINLELDKVAQADYRLWREDLEHVVTVWTELLEEGYRVNTKYDDYSSSCAVFIIPPDGNDNSGYILTGRGGNAYRAVSEAIYKHEVLLSGVWGAALAERRGHDDPDF